VWVSGAGGVQRVGDSNGGEPAYDGKDMIVTKGQLVRRDDPDNRTIYVTALAGAVPYFVGAV
jgi:hypothetical protein